VRPIVRCGKRSRTSGSKARPSSSRWSPPGATVSLRPSSLRSNTWATCASVQASPGAPPPTPWQPARATAAAASASTARRTPVGRRRAGAPAATGTRTGLGRGVGNDIVASFEVRAPSATAAAQDPWTGTGARPVLEGEPRRRGAPHRARGQPLPKGGGPRSWVVRADAPWPSSTSAPRGPVPVCAVGSAHAPRRRRGRPRRPRHRPPRPARPPRPRRRGARGRTRGGRQGAQQPRRRLPLRLGARWLPRQRPRDDRPGALAGARGATAVRGRRGPRAATSTSTAASAPCRRRSRASSAASSSRPRAS
jgi:hypothetical protein